MALGPTGHSWVWAQASDCDPARGLGDECPSVFRAASLSLCWLLGLKKNFHCNTTQDPNSLPSWGPRKESSLGISTCFHCRYRHSQPFPPPGQVRRQEVSPCWPTMRAISVALGPSGGAVLLVCITPPSITCWSTRAVPPLVQTERSSPFLRSWPSGALRVNISVI